MNTPWIQNPGRKGCEAALPLAERDLTDTEQTALAVALAAIDDASGASGQTAFNNVARAASSTAPALANLEQGGQDAAQNLREIASAGNPGSVGHPELCPRPCLYFPVGRCANGVNCSFCHLPHPKRPAHLDKRHRIMLKEMSFHECLSMMLPILRQKLQLLLFGPEVKDLLDSLEGSTLVSATVPPGTHALQTALQAMSLRSLLTTLHRHALPHTSPEQAAIDGLLKQLRFQEEALLHCQAMMSESL